jgi:polygalacturonase
MALPRFTSLAMLLAFAPAAVASERSFNVRDFGAVPDGQTLNTDAFARAEAACVAAGGGTLVVPPGRFLTGSVHLFSNTTLQLDGGAEVLYSANPADSPLVASRWEGTSAFIHAPLIYAADATNIAITGRGTLNGQGRYWWWRQGQYDSSRSAEIAPAIRAWLQLSDRIEAGAKVSAADFTLAAEHLRPSLVLFNGCRNVQVEGVTLTESPMWMLNPLYCENVSIRGVTFNSTGPNGDGIDVDSSRDVRISDCFFNTGDDCIVIKSGRNADGRRINRPTEHVTITNCVMHRGHGAIVIGSETSGGIRDIVASNIVAHGTDSGIRIKSMRGRGGIVEDVRCDNFVIEDAGWKSDRRDISPAIEITLLYEPTQPEILSERTPIFRNFSFSHLTIVHAREVAGIYGLQEKSIDGLRFEDISATGEFGFICDHVNNVELNQVRVSAVRGSPYVFTHATGMEIDPVTPAGAKAGPPASSATASLPGPRSTSPSPATKSD